MIVILKFQSFIQDIS